MKKKRQSVDANTHIIVVKITRQGFQWRPCENASASNDKHAWKQEKKELEYVGKEIKDLKENWMTAQNTKIQLPNEKIETLSAPERGEQKKKINELEDERWNWLNLNNRGKKTIKKWAQLHRVVGLSHGTNIYVITALRGEKWWRRKRIQSIIDEDFQNLAKDMSDSRSCRNPDCSTQKKSKSRCILVRQRQKILKAAREKQQITCKGKIIWITGDFSSQISKAQRKWDNIFQVQKKVNLEFYIPWKWLSEMKGN